ncbi:MAG: hypothetical protein B6I36_09615 [Desulfobacteraceae bacterium 4572_35.1]|nr:MAG: hypothetical protein B6I36_09615 [Desulfobacteraceae bacterium 4572_35.1]
MWPIAKITFLEGFRSQVLYGIFLFALFVMVMSIVFSNFFMQDIGKVAVDFNLSAISFAGLLICLSVSINLISKDLDKKTIHFVLSKPISRTSYVFGKFFGISLIVLFAYLILTVLSGLVLMYLKYDSAQYFGMFSWAAYLQAIYFDLLKISLLNGIIILFSTVTTSSFLTMLLSISIYVVGQTISAVVGFIQLQTTDTGFATCTQKIIDVVKYLVPNFSAFDFKVISAHGMLVTPGEFFSFTAYGLCYLLLVLLAAAGIFSRKEFL